MQTPSNNTDRWTSWDRFLEATSSTGFMQSSWWAEFRTTVGFENFGIVLKSGDTIFGGAMVQKFSYGNGSCFYYIQDGPVLPADESFAGEVFEATLHAIEERRKTEQETVSHLRIEPRWLNVPEFVSGFRNAPLDKFGEPRNTLCVDLRPSETAILAQMKPKGRYNIGVARKHSVSVVEDTSERGLEDFLEIYETTADRQRFEEKPPDYFEPLISMLATLKRGAIYFAEYQGIRLATAIVVYFGERVTYFYGGSLAIHKNVMAPYLLHFEIMRKAKAMGYTWYDFWGVAPDNEPTHPWHNISIFKHKFGGAPVTLVPTLDYVYDQTLYDQFPSLSDVEGVEVESVEEKT